jgi:hypothetical protein
MPTLYQPFIPIDASSISDARLRGRVWRLNCLGSLFLFIKIALRRKRMTMGLHYPMCNFFEKDHIKDVVEFPRDHFKSTICGEGRPMWRALPFMPEDADDFAKLGYSDEFVRWMYRMHNPARRTLLVSENQTNARKLGNRIKTHFESNATYRALFPETLPTTKEIWSTDSLHVRQLANLDEGGHGEGTFDFIGVGGALQSRHYHEVDQDDLVGKKALQSSIIMDSTIDYHKLLQGAFENEDKDHSADELVVGNRWAYSDLNSHIREHEPWFSITSHSAVGGCCNLHPAGTPIFPEEYSLAKLAQIKTRFGSYWYSCQYLNDPSAPEDADFDNNWLRYYDIKHGNPYELGERDYVAHETHDGMVMKNLAIGHLKLCIIVDPQHSGNIGSGRSRHAITVIGLDPNTNFYYLIDYWAKQASRLTMIDEIYNLAKRWRVRRVGVETAAGQGFLLDHLKYRNQNGDYQLKVVELKCEVEGPDGTMVRKKEWRIRAVLQPIFEAGRFWVQRNQQDFINEYKRFPKGQFVDILDTCAYMNEMLKTSISPERELSWKLQNTKWARKVGQSYGYEARVV